MDYSPGSTSSWRGVLRRMPGTLTRPCVLLLLALGVHAAGRIAAFCGPFKVDSLVYAASAYRLWQPDATVRDLVPDKPPGQALLTGWCYRVLPDPPSRLTLVPIESVFMLGAYAVFWRTASRFFHRRAAAGLTLLVVISFNAYNALDTTTDGFNLNENYMALPLWLAVWAHTTIEDPHRRGLLRGLGLGVALSIKQTAAGLCAALLLDGIYRYARGAHRRAMLVSGLSTVAAVAGIGLLLGLFLASRGWLAPYLSAAWRLSSERVGTGPLRWPEDYKLLPIAPFAWWIVLGLLSLFWRADPAASAQRSSETDHGALARVTGLWLAAETLLLWHLQIPSTHYYQQLVAPAALLAGVALCVLNRRLALLPRRERLDAWHGITGTTLALGLLAVMPLLAAASKLLPTFDAAEEARVFEEYVELVTRAGSGS